MHSRPTRKRTYLVACSDISLIVHYCACKERVLLPGRTVLLWIHLHSRLEALNVLVISFHPSCHRPAAWRHEQSSHPHTQLRHCIPFPSLGLGTANTSRLRITGSVAYPPSLIPHKSFRHFTKNELIFLPNCVSKR